MGRLNRAGSRLDLSEHREIHRDCAQSQSFSPVLKTRLHYPPVIEYVHSSAYKRLSRTYVQTSPTPRNLRLHMSGMKEKFQRIERQPLHRKLRLFLLDQHKAASSSEKRLLMFLDDHTIMIGTEYARKCLNHSDKNYIK
ncbi:hypothetical protein RRG08_024185 [Elysia crispata]|uniref:Uncharacterized protein n=1 Tax=Elysia crispata TaxID=231223 RepID=A0AAE0YR92_9GAST|nr:hypothetical protein RRG08_024185 [Elysia crispata]